MMENCRGVKNDTRRAATDPNVPIKHNSLSHSSSDVRSGEEQQLPWVFGRIGILLFHLLDQRQPLVANKK